MPAEVELPTVTGVYSTKQGDNSLDLGGCVVHGDRLATGAVCIVAVDSQRRGRVFPPFADDDPKAAEVHAAAG